MALQGVLTKVGVSIGVMQVMVSEHCLVLSGMPGGPIVGLHYYILPWRVLSLQILN